MTTNNTFLSKLIRRQRKNKQTDQVFADQIKIARSSWTQIRLGDQAIGLSLLSGVAKAFPDMEKDIISFLRGNNRNEY